MRPAFAFSFYIFNAFVGPLMNALTQHSPSRAITQCCGIRLLWDFIQYCDRLREGTCCTHRTAVQWHKPATVQDCGLCRLLHGQLHKHTHSEGGMNAICHNVAFLNMRKKEESVMEAKMWIKARVMFCWQTAKNNWGGSPKNIEVFHLKHPNNEKKLKWISVGCLP